MWDISLLREELDIPASELNESQAALDEMSIEERYERLRSIQDPIGNPLTIGGKSGTLI